MLAALVAAGGADAQVRVLEPQPQRIKIGGLQVMDDSAPTADTGPAVRMPVSLNIDRHLRKAQGFLEREDWSSAFAVLHDVVEGRTLTDDETGGGATPEPDDAALWDEASARQAVFSNDDRIFRPVKALCHELLASLPPAGISAYRAQFEFDAERELAAAREACDVSSLERLVDRYFVTLSAARALELAGDLRMDRGQFRAALQNFRVLLEVYPEAGRADAGIDDAYVRCKVALCFAMLGAGAEARAELDRLARLAPDATLRVQGELFAVVALAELPTFSAAERPAQAGRPENQPFVVASEFVPLWEFRFGDTRPYRAIRDDSRRGRFRPVEGGAAVSVSPSLYAPGTSATVTGERIAFLDHYRARVHEAITGRMLLETDERVEDTPRANQPRARVPVYDFSTARLTVDATRVVAVLGAEHPKQMEAVLDNRLVTYDRSHLEPVWESGTHSELRDVTFLAAPTLTGTKLLVPILERGTVGLQALDAATGAPLYRVAIHRGGTILARPAASPVVVDQGTAFVLSNAGALAAVDVHTGSLLWIRRYERVHPLRPDKLRVQSRQEHPFGFNAYTEVSQLPGFAPSEIVTVDGLVVLAPCDGNVLLCIDGASGEPQWMLNRAQRVPSGNHKERWQYVIGHDGRQLVVGGDQGVSGIDLRTGVRLWRAELPSAPAQNSWRGRGVVTHGHVIVPGVRALLLRPLDARSAAWRRVPLPELSIGREPLTGPFNVDVSGIFLTASFEGGIEVYSTVDSLLLLADASELPERRALLEAQAGDMVAAFETLEGVDLPAIHDAGRRADVTQRLLTTAGELAVAMAAHGAERDALAVLDRCRARLDRTHDIKHWHIARIEVFETLGDLDAIEAEQRALYALMEAR